MTTVNKADYDTPQELAIKLRFFRLHWDAAVYLSKESKLEFDNGREYLRRRVQYMNARFDKALPPLPSYISKSKKLWKESWEEEFDRYLKWLIEIIPYWNGQTEAQPLFAQTQQSSQSTMEDPPCGGRRPEGYISWEVLQRKYPGSVKTKKTPHAWHDKHRLRIWRESEKANSKIHYRESDLEELCLPYSPQKTNSVDYAAKLDGNPKKAT